MPVYGNKHKHEKTHISAIFTTGTSMIIIQRLDNAKQNNRKLMTVVAMPETLLNFIIQKMVKSIQPIIQGKEDPQII